MPRESGDNVNSPDDNTVTHISDESAKCILALLKSGEEKIDFGSDRDVVLILGNTGSGKTTFTNFIAGDNDRMISTEVRKYTGEFIISDNDGKISDNSTIISKTTFPELMVDNETKIAYIDNPGFNDSRNEAYDVAAAYFIKKVFETVKNAKIVLITSYPSVRKGVNRIDFLQLLEHLTVLLKNIDMFVDSIALVVTKVDNTFVMRDGAPVLIPDHVVVETIADFLTEVKESLVEMSNTNEAYISELKRVENKVFYQNAIKLLNALLTEEDSRFTRLCIFRRPNEPGRISQIPLLQNSKKTVVDMIRKNLRYLPTENALIGYTISDKSKNVIRDLVAEVNANIIVNVAAINADLITYFHNLELEMYNHDMYALRDRLKSASKVLSQIVTIDKSLNAGDFAKLISENFASIEIPISKSRLRDIANLGKFLIFLQDISAKIYESFVWKWIKELDGIILYIDNALKWYIFLVALHERLSQYNVQKNKASYRIPTFDAFPDKNLLVEDFTGISAFLRAIGENSVSETVYYEEIKQIRIDDTKLRYFDRLLRATLSDTLVYKSLDDGKTLQVTGQYVSLSEVSTNELYKSCESMRIFAKHTVFVDANLSKNDDISIIAPRWEIVGTPTISVNGRTAPVHSISQAKAGESFGERGEDGMPGFPGQSGGRFVGIGSEFRHMKNLSITANGGVGGQGQHGGDGANGKTGQTFTIVDQSMYLKSVISNFNSYQIEKKEIIFKASGGQGGDGGKGGIGGIGGDKGVLITIDTSNMDGFINSLKIANEGEPGMSGCSGNPGCGGEDGTVLEEHTYRDRDNYGYYNSSKRFVLYAKIRGSVGKSGSQPNTPSKVGCELPKSRKFCNLSPIIADYRNELVNNFDNSIQKHTSWLFYKEIQQNSQLHQYYNANILSRELQHLEKHHRRLTLDITLTLYSGILEKILHVAESQPDQNDLLECLHLVTANKLLRLQSRLKIHTSLNLEIGIHRTLVEDRALTVLHFVDSIFENDLESSIDCIDAQIIELSFPPFKDNEDDIHELGDLLLERKTFGDLKKFTKFLRFLSILTHVDSEIIENLEISEILPSLKFRTVKTSPLKNELETAMYDFRSDVSTVIDALRALVSTERKTYQKCAESRAEIVNGLRDIERNLLRTIITKDFSTNEIMQNFVKLAGKLASVDDKSQVETSSFNEIEMVKRIDNGRKLIEFDCQLYNKVNRESNIERLIQALYNTKNSNDQRRCYSMQLDTLMVLILKTVRDNITEPYDSDKISAIRKAVLDFVDPAQKYLKYITEQFQNNEELWSLVQNLLEIVNMLRDAFEVTACVELKTRSRIQSQRVNEKNSDGFGECARKDFLLYEYEHLVDAFKRSCFPFNVLNPETVVIPQLFNDADQSSADLQKSIENNETIMKNAVNTLLKNPPTEYTMEENFDATTAAGPLFEWKNALYAKNIANLLRGGQIALTATVAANHHRQYLRFHSIRLRLRAPDEAAQALLDDALSNFNLHLIHSGRSTYAFCNQLYTLNEANHEYQHANHSEAQTENPRSPYAIWLFSLKPANETVTSYASLRAFIDQPIDLMLEGRAKYLKIDDTAAICRKLEIDGASTDYSTLVNRRIVDMSSENDVSETSDSSKTAAAQ